MPGLDEPQNAEWPEVWDARIAALTPILGQPANTVYHATIPFQFRDAGGSADVVPFPNYIPGATYVTAELTGTDSGQLPNSLGRYELMICSKEESPTAADFVSRLACYTCEAELEAGQTMDIGEFFGDSTLRAVVFAHPTDQPSHFEFLGERHTLLLCVGITPDELDFARSRNTDELLDLLKKHGVFPYTVPGRQSIPPPAARSRAILQALEPHRANPGSPLRVDWSPRWLRQADVPRQASAIATAFIVSDRLRQA